MTLLEVQGLCKRFGGVNAVDGLDFAVEAGAVFSIIGPNGAGKTTLFNMLSGLFAPSEGRICLDGENVTGLAPHQLAGRGISRSFQNLQIFFNMSALENVLVGHHLHSDTRFLPSLLRLPAMRRGERRYREYATELMSYVGLDEFVGANSQAMPYGALRRLEIARALATRPRLLMLDEPAAGLNPAETQAIDALIKRIARDGTTVLLVEHDMHLVWGVSDHILVLDHGRLLAQGTAAQIRADPSVIETYLGHRARTR
ncbi:Branched-chain amino acid transport ATP-binding protein LivG (TC 3.A.1.4.1) [hydrothermal vent metagenome]|uniref:Branched-chain amino acid transport ATP-binding protein LivG (TC 3.A.1.4.1) n=1 Tax=hydrothermal vent metagenome TaxID=652676 RepID=A0A3B0UAR7_9ZZZZ